VGTIRGELGVYLPEHAEGLNEPRALQAASPRSQRRGRTMIAEIPSVFRQALSNPPDDAA
jgi:hypothetical protein